MTISEQQSCPSCGRCPHCGHVPRPAAPYVWPYPIYPTYPPVRWQQTTQVMCSTQASFTNAAAPNTWVPLSD